MSFYRVHHRHKEGLVVVPGTWYSVLKMMVDDGAGDRKTTDFK